MERYLRWLLRMKNYEIEDLWKEIERLEKEVKKLKEEGEIEDKNN